MRLLAFLAVAFPVWLSATPAFANDQPRVELTWTAPEECPTGDEVLADAHDLAKAAAKGEGEVLVVDGKVTQDDAGRWHLTLTVGVSQRELEAASCRELSSAGALFIALLISPSMMPRLAGEASTGEAAQPEVDTPAPAEPAAPVQLGDDVPQTRRTPPRWHLALGLGVDAGLLPDPVLLPQLLAGVRLQRWQLEVGAAVGSKQRKAVGEPEIASLELMPVLVDAGACRLFLDRRSVGLGSCMALELGVMSAEGNSSVGVRSRTVVRSALALDPLTTWIRLAPILDLRAQLGAAIGLNTPNFAIQGPGSVHEPAPGGFRGAVLLEFRTNRRPMW